MGRAHAEACIAMGGAKCQVWPCAVLRARRYNQTMLGSKDSLSPVAVAPDAASRGRVLLEGQTAEAAERGVANFSLLTVRPQGPAVPEGPCFSPTQAAGKKPTWG